MDNPSYHLEGIIHDRNELTDFEGPLSLILMLLAKNKIEIRDIKIGDILDQYLEYLEKMQSMDLEIASEFVQMAAHLLYIKTRTLLAADEKEVSELELLIASLEQLKGKDTFEQLKKVIPQLKSASELGLLYYQKNPEPLPKKGRTYEYRHKSVDLLRALAAIYSRGVKTPENEALMLAVPRRMIYSVRDKSREVLEKLRGGSATLRTLYSECSSRSEVIATFISVLELCSMGSIHLTGDESGDYAVTFVGGDVDEILERIIES